MPYQTNPTIKDRIERILSAKSKDGKIDDKASTKENTVKDGGKKKKTTAKKPKGKEKEKGKLEEEPLSKEEETAKILEIIADKRQKRAIKNRYPEPDSKIFLSTRPRTA